MADPATTQKMLSENRKDYNFKCLIISFAFLNKEISDMKRVVGLFVN